MTFNVVWYSQVDAITRGEMDGAEGHNILLHLDFNLCVLVRGVVQCFFSGLLIKKKKSAPESGSDSSHVVVLYAYKPIRKYVYINPFTHWKVHVTCQPERSEIHRAWKPNENSSEVCVNEFTIAQECCFECDDMEINGNSTVASAWIGTRFI